MTLREDPNERTTAATRSTLRVLARSVIKELKRSGYRRAEMVAFASELLDVVTTELRDDRSEQS
jgi:hypothetical protein